MNLTTSTMLPVAKPRSIERILVLVIALALVLARAIVYLAWEQSHFDADQAVVGLMAKHLIEGRAFPLYFYGQQYLLGVEAWIVAPFFAVFGMSVLTLKLPLLLMNAAAAAMLILGLERFAGLRPALGLVVSLFFLLPPPGTASRLVQANGCNIEPFLYVLLLWIFRERPVAFGLTAGLGILHREFTAYGVAAVLVVEFARGAFRSRRFWGALCLSALVALGVWELVRVSLPYASASGPRSSYAELGIQSYISVVGDRFCWNEGQFGDRFGLLLSEWLPQMFGARREAIEKVGVVSTRAQGLDGLWPALGLALGLAAARLIYLEWGRTPPWFCAFLILVGLQSVVMYAAMCGQRSHLTMRYMLLGLLMPVGLCGWYLSREPRRWLVQAFSGVVVVWALVSAVAHTRLIHEYVTATPANDYRRLTAHLEANGVERGSAGFWDAYAVTFLSGERVRLASVDVVRIEEYQSALGLPRSEAPYISPVACAGERVARWWVCR